MQFVQSKFTQVAKREPLSTIPSQALMPRAVHDGLVASAYHVIHVEFMRDRLVSSESPAPFHTWPGFLADCDEFPLGRKCLSTLAQAFVGQTRGLPELSMSGTRSYLESVRSLQHALSLLSARSSNDTLLAVMILELYEMLMLSSHDGWIRHALGLAKIIEIRGPHSFCDPFSLKLFETNRFIVCLACLASSSPTFLSQAAWKRIPWQANPSSKDSMQCLLDSFADLTTLKSRISHDRPGATTRDEIQLIIDLLPQWREEWDAQNCGHACEVPNEDPDDRNIIPSVLTFSTTLVANCACIYNATMILAVSLTWLHTGDDGDFKHKSLAYTAAMDICKIVKNYIPQAAGQMSTQFTLLYPLRMAWTVFHRESHSQQQHWVERMLKQIILTGNTWSVASQTLLPFPRQ